MNSIIKDNLAYLHELCKKFDVEKMYIFGSSSNGTFHKNSDIDILISFKELSIEEYTDNYFELHYELENLFNRKIDLLTDKSIENPYLRESIEKSMELIYAA